MTIFARFPYLLLICLMMMLMLPSAGRAQSSPPSESIATPVSPAPVTRGIEAYTNVKVGEFQLDLSGVRSGLKAIPAQTPEKPFITVGNFAIACERCAEELTAARGVITAQGAELVALREQLKRVEDSGKLKDEQIKLANEKAAYWEEHAAQWQLAATDLESRNAELTTQLEKKNRSGQRLRKVLPYLVGVVYVLGKIGF